MTDADEIENFVVQTAELRFSVKSDGLRQLLKARGHDPAAVIQHSCDHGDDVHIGLYLEDGSAVSLDYREHYQTRQAIKIASWEMKEYSDREAELANQILSGDTTDFDREVRAYFDRELASSDAALPPLSWGDREWHAWESKPTEHIERTSRR